MRGSYDGKNAEFYGFIRRNEVILARLNFTRQHADDLYREFSAIDENPEQLKAYAIRNTGSGLQMQPFAGSKTGKAVSRKKGTTSDAKALVSGASQLMTRETGIRGLLYTSDAMNIAVLRVQGNGVTRERISIPYGSTYGPVPMHLDGVGALIHAQGRDSKRNAEGASAIFEAYFRAKKTEEQGTKKPKISSAEEFKEMINLANEIYIGMTEDDAFREGLKMGRHGVENYWARFWDSFYNFRHDF